MATYDKCSSDHFSSVIKWMQQVFHPSAVAVVVAVAEVVAAAAVLAAAVLAAAVLVAAVHRLA